LVGKLISLPNYYYCIQYLFGLILRARDNPTSTNENGKYIYIEKLTMDYVGLYKTVAYVNQMDESSGNAYEIHIYNSADGITDNEERAVFNLDMNRNVNLLINNAGYPYIRYSLIVSGSSPLIDFEMYVSDIK
jgi:hypothetical protein